MQAGFVKSDEEMKDQKMDLPLLAAISLLASFLPLVSGSFSINSHLKIVALQQPPFSFKRLDGSWTGIEVRYLEILSEHMNFTFEVEAASDKIVASKNTKWASSDHAVVVEVSSGNADLGIGGVHLVPESADEDSEVHQVYPHSQDCGMFLTQGSLALPRHRAIMGPFHWKVWLSLTIAYLFGSIPLTLLYSTGERALLPPSSATYSLTIKKPSIFKRLYEMVRRLHEAFWDVFGTFTNAFTLEKGWRSVGVKLEAVMEESKRPTSFLSMERRKSSNATSWIGSLNEQEMAALVGKEGLRLLVSFYWAFTVIVSALYTGSIIAFITLPVYPKPYETGEELLRAGFIWGTLASGDWAQWLRDSDGPVGEQVRKFTARAEAYGCGCRGMRLFRSAEKGIRSVEESSDLAFLSSKSLISYLISHPASTNEEEEEEDVDGGSLFSLSILKKVVGRMRKRPVLVMTSECFLPFRIGFLVKRGEEGRRISESLKQGLLIAEQAGLLEKGRQDADEEVGGGEEEEINKDGTVVSSSEKRWRTTHGQSLIFGGGFRLGQGVLTERVLSLDDVQGIFLLLGAGFAISFFALFMEIIVANINKRFHGNHRHKDDETGIESEFSDYQDVEIDTINEGNWQHEESESEGTKDDKEDNRVFNLSTPIQLPRRTSAPAPATDIYQRELSKVSIHLRRAKSACVH